MKNKIADIIWLALLLSCFVFIYLIANKNTDFNKKQLYELEMRVDKLELDIAAIRRYIK